MNIAFGAVVIVALLYPGVTLRILYLRGIDLKAVFGSIRKQRSSGRDRLNERPIQYYRDVSKSKFRIFGQAVWEQVIASLLPAFLVHIVTIKFVSGGGYWPENSPDYALIYKILVADKLADESIQQLADSLPRFVCYFLSSLLVAGGIGLLARAFIKRYYIDLEVKLLRFSNDWDYLLSGRILGKSVEGLDVIWIHVLSETKEQSIIYDGFLWDYELADNNGLDRVILFNVSKRFIRKQSSGFRYQKEAKFSQAAGEQFLNQEEFSYNESEEINEQLVVFPYSQLKNIAITYVDLDKVTSAKQA